MRVHSLTIVHYGADYLSYALRSVYSQVDVCHVFYTPTPSHGHQTNIPPVESKEQLVQAAYAYDPDGKIKWYDVAGVTREGQHRDLALQTIIGAGADMVIVTDCDEVWPADVLRASIAKVAQTNSARNWLANMTHFWRSFDWACNDQGWPVRVIDLRHHKGTEYLQTGKVLHFGYAITDAIMKYKWEIHGHKGELRPHWLDEVWPEWPPPDNCHPTNGRNERGEAFWTPEPFDKAQMPLFMCEHPFYNLDKIE
jgi:hypothetical protein